MLPELFGNKAARKAKDKKDKDRLRACKKIARTSCISSSGHIWLRCNRKILDVALLSLRFYSITVTKSDPNMSAILPMLFSYRPSELKTALKAYFFLQL